MQINAKFGGKVPFHNISRPFFFCFSKFCIFGFLRIFFVWTTWDHMGEKISSNISSERAQQICSQKFMHAARKGLYQSCIKNCEISNFIFGKFFCSFWGRLTWESMGNDKMCDILETAGLRAKRTKIWTSGVSV